MIRNCDIIKIICKSKGYSVAQIDRLCCKNGYLINSIAQNTITKTVADCIGDFFGEDLSYLINSREYDKNNGQD